MRLFNFNSLRLLMSAAVIAGAVSCSREYSLDNIDGHVTVGGDSLAFPLGSIDTVRLTSFIDSEDLEMLKTDENGNYFLYYSRDFDQVVDLTDYTDDIMVEGVEVGFSRSLYVPGEGEEGEPAAGGESVRLPLDFDEDFVLRYSFESAREAGLEEIDSVIFEDAMLSAAAVLSSDRELPYPMDVEVTVIFPDRYDFADSPDIEGNTVVMKGQLDMSGEVTFSHVMLEKIIFNLDREDSFEFEDAFTVSRFTIIAQPQDISYLAGGNIDVDLTVTVGSENGADIYPSGFYGKINMELDPVEEEIVIEGIPDFMDTEDAVLDFFNPHAELTLSTNAGIPVVIDASITAEGPSRENIDLTLPIPYSYDPGQEDSVMYYLSAEEPSVPGDYEWVEADMGKLMRKIPESVSFTARAWTDYMSEEVHYVDCDAEYNVHGVFRFVLPFAFGEDLYMTVSQTMEGIPEMFGQIVADTDLILGGEIESTFPVSLEIGAVFLDSKGNPLDIDVSTQRIESAAADGQPVVSPLNLTVTSTGREEDIAAVSLRFTLLPGSEPGLSLSDRAYVQASVSVAAPGGVTVDINDFMGQTE